MVVPECFKDDASQ